MRTNPGNTAWVQHVGVAVAYAVAYSLLKEVSYSHWLLVAGLRLGVLLLLPYRYWPALLVGEAGALAYTAFPCAGRYGTTWAIWFTVPPMLLAMPIVHWFRKQRWLFPAKAATSMNGLLLCTLLVSALGALENIATFSLMRLGPGQVISYGSSFARYFLGHYIGVLTIVPMLLLVREDLLSTPRNQLWRKLSESRLAMESVSLLLPSLALLAWLASGVAGSDASEVARVAMFLPVAWLALRHGWRGAAIGGSAASIAVVVTMPVWHDSATLQAQVFIAFTTTTMLLLGARIAALYNVEKNDRMNVRMALAVAQRNVFVGEMQLRQTSYLLEQMSQTIRASHDQLLGRLRFLLPSTDERGYHRQAAITQQQMYRLADTLYPLSWGERGLPAALREGSIPRALDEAGIGYWCEITGRGLSELSPSIHLALYRLAGEAVASICAGRNVGRISIRLRGGVLGARRWAVLCIDGYTEVERPREISWGDLLPTLGGTGMGIVAIKDRAAAFEGRARERQLATGRRISLILFEPEESQSAYCRN